MKNASILASLVLLFSLSFAGEFLCGGTGGIPCTTDCQGQWSESMHDYMDGSRKPTTFIPNWVQYPAACNSFP